MTTQTIGSRLAVSFAIAFIAAGLLLLGLNYLLIQRQLETTTSTSPSDRLAELGITLNPELAAELPESFDPSTTPPLGDQPITAGGRTFAEVLQDVEGSVRSDTLNTLLLQGAIAIVAVAAIAALVGWWLSQRALRPVADITRTAKSLSEDDLTARVGLNGPADEVKELADTFDAMLDRLERGYTQHRNFAAVASHELRTPLTVMRVEADNALDDPETSEQHRAMAQRIVASIDKSDRMIEMLMALTGSGAGLTNISCVDLAEITGEAVAELSQSATDNAVRLDLDLHDACVSGERTLLAVLVSNLVDNAIVHNIEGGWAKINVDIEGPAPRLTVTNSGYPYTVEQANRILEPFARIATEETRGTGLGLATAAAIVDAHGGRMHAEPLDGGGLAVTVLFPTADPRDDQPHVAAGTSMTGRAALRQRGQKS